MLLFNSGYTGFGAWVANRAVFLATHASAGIGISAFGTSSPIVFMTTTSNLERMRIQSDGTVGIGTASPTSLLHITAGTNTIAPFGLTTGPVLTTPLAGKLEYTTPTLFFTNGDLIRQEIPQIQQSRVASDFSSSSTTVANITGITASLAAGKTYKIEADLYITSDLTSGFKLQYNYTGSTTSVVSDMVIYTLSTGSGGLYQTNRITSFASSLTANTNNSGIAPQLVHLSGTVTANAAGTLTLQFGIGGGVNTSTVLRGSTMTITQIL